jgi:phosphatidylinositol alpha-1,6-mannosyltransferase
MRKLHIGLVAPEFPPAMGGLQTYGWELACALAELGHAVEVFVGKNTWDGRPTPFVVRPILDLRARTDGPALRAVPVDVWHGTNAACAWLGNVMTAPVFVTVAGNDLLSPYLPFGRLDLRTRFRLPFGSRLDHWLGRQLTVRLMRRGFPRVAGVFAISRTIRTLAIERYSLTLDRVHLVPPAASATFTSQPPRPASERKVRQVISVCRLSEPRKNIDGVLRALAQLPADLPPWRYVVVGDGILRGSLEALATSLGIADRVEFAGSLPTPDLINRLRASDLFVLPSRTDSTSIEGFGIVYLEAAACGVPSIAAAGGGADDAIEPGESGWILPDPEPATIAAQLEKCLRGTAAISPEKCQQHARRFSWTTSASRMVTHYESALAR